MRQEIANRDRTPRRHDGAPGIGTHGDRRVLEIRNEPAHRVVERELPFLDERHQRDAGERLGLRRDAEYRVRCHLPLRLAIRPTEGALVHCLAVFEHERDRAGDLQAIHGPLHHRIDAR